MKSSMSKPIRTDMQNPAMGQGPPADAWDNGFRCMVENSLAGKPKSLNRFFK